MKHPAVVKSSPEVLAGGLIKRIRGTGLLRLTTTQEIEQKLQAIKLATPPMAT